MPTRPLRAAARLAATSVLLLVPPVWAADAPRVSDTPAVLRLGQTLLQRDCGACHAVGPRGASPRPGAPAFRDLSRRYPVDALGEALAEGLVTGHPGMPEFRFAPDEVEAILRYLRSVQTAPRPKQNAAASAPTSRP